MMSSASDSPRVGAAKSARSPLQTDLEAKAHSSHKKTSYALQTRLFPGAGSQTFELTPAEQAETDRQVVEDVRKNASLQVARAHEALKEEQTKNRALEEAIRKSELRSKATQGVVDGLQQRLT